MPLFQKSVLNKYLKEQDKTVVEKAYDVYYNYFHNPEIQRNIYASKEEQFQEGFLRELFVNVFGFVLNPNPDFNLTTEFKNEKGAKKADGAVLKEGKAIAVIELKSTKTKDLESIRQQAFDYKANQSECVYVITSNFQKLRFYVNNAVEFEEFDLFALSKERFEVLYLCLGSQNLLTNLPLKIKNASLLEEESITKKFYADYSLFKKELFEDIAKRNTDMEGVSKLQLYKKTQKLLDRFLFIFFAEDRGLLPPNSISRMIKRWNVLNDEDAYKPLYEIYKQYFGYLNTGRAGKVSADDIQAYNGGLFLIDELLDKIEIDDAVLLKHTSVLTNYDFDSQVDVNILGHIFEHSLNEIETTTAELEGVDFDKQKSKRKKDGVFYTPKYITKYIVDNTVGKLCEEKKTELSIKDDEFTPNRKKETKKKLLASLEAYRKWLLELTICDPACGSGAFLNQALEYLINEHHFIDGLNAQLFGSTMVFQDVENQILEHNIFGVDINEESVDIARLSLWLRTAQRGRKLTTLNKNIKCGNSLIDDMDVAGDKAFNWEKEFPEVFKNGGFDVVIGNPPYGVNITEGKEYFKKNYKSTEGPFELYKFFIEKSLNLLKKGGVNSFITPDTWINLSYFKKLRHLIFIDYELVQCSVSLYKVFEDAIVDTCIYIIANNKLIKTEVFIAVDESLTRLFDASIKFSNNDYLLNFKKKNPAIQRIDKQSNSLDVYTEIWRGMSAYGAKNPERPFNSSSKDTEFHKKLLNGGDISKYSIKWNGEYIKYGAWLHRPRPEYIYSNPKIMIQRIRNPKLRDRIVAVSDKSGYISSDGISNVLLKPEYIGKLELDLVLGILNSKLINYWFSYYFFDVNIKPEQLRQIPFPSPETVESIGSVSLIESKLFKEEVLIKIKNSLINYLNSQYLIISLTKKLKNWHKLEFGEFNKELNKAIKKAGGEKLNKIDEMEWMEVFETKKAEAQTLKTEIDKTDKEIDRMVYELYGLSEEEIGIVEQNN